MGTRVVALIALVSGVAFPASAAESRPAIVPQPAKMVVQEGAFTFGPGTAILVTDATRREGDYLASALSPATGYPFPVRSTSDATDTTDAVVLRIVDDKDHLGAEGYHLTVSQDRVLIEAHAPAGVFYGCQTLRQLLPPAILSDCRAGGVDWSVPCLEIEDVPRYSWRGLMLDPGHNFLTVEFTKRYIDVMAYYKMNRLHWHLTDIGWAIEIEKYPELTDIERWPAVTPRWRRAYGKCIRGFYSQDEVREVVAYAAARHIMVIPEIELPGHACAALGSYPELGCPNAAPAAKVDSWRDYPSVYCAGSDQTFEFLETVFDEVLELFPAPWVHVGGDERVKGHWAKCPKCQARIKAEGLKDEDELQSYFVKRMETYLNGKDRRLVGWTEIAEGGLASSATLQSWLEMSKGADAASHGHDVIMSPHNSCYLNYSHTKTPVAKTYAFEPTPSELAADKASHILGVEACIWGFPQHRLDRLVFPRLCAIAEVGWSPEDARDWDDFSGRLRAHGRRLDEFGIDYHRDASVW
ncbi:MAG: beta-N-acetylhexosaminidase [bacterium]|nr:beta-N-acetylhexosaminidase [bacterium]